MNGAGGPRFYFRCRQHRRWLRGKEDRLGNFPDPAVAVSVRRVLRSSQYSSLPVSVCADDFKNLAGSDYQAHQ